MQHKQPKQQNQITKLDNLLNKYEAALNWTICHQYRTDSVIMNKMTNISKTVIIDEKKVGRAVNPRLQRTRENHFAHINWYSLHDYEECGANYIRFSTQIGLLNGGGCHLMFNKSKFYTIQPGDNWWFLYDSVDYGMTCFCYQITENDYVELAEQYSSLSDFQENGFETRLSLDVIIPPENRHNWKKINEFATIDTKSKFSEYKISSSFRGARHNPITLRLFYDGKQLDKDRTYPSIKDAYNMVSNYCKCKNEHSFITQIGKLIKGTKSFMRGKKGTDGENCKITFCNGFIDINVTSTSYESITSVHLKGDSVSKESYYNIKDQNIEEHNTEEYQYIVDQLLTESPFGEQKSNQGIVSTTNNTNMDDKLIRKTTIPPLIS